MCADPISILISTLAGGSRLFFRDGLFIVGPESASAHPGPICYRKNGYLAITDANVFLGRIVPEFFPKIFGPNENEALDVDASRSAFVELSKTINAYFQEHHAKEVKKVNCTRLFKTK